MEKQRSCSWKSTKFLALSLTISFCLVLLSFLSFWVMRASPMIDQEAYMLLSTPSLSLSLNSLNFQPFTVPYTDSSGFSLNSTNLNNTQISKPKISSISVENISNEVILSSRKEVNSENITRVEERNDEGFANLGTNFSVSISVENSSNEVILSSRKEVSSENITRVEERNDEGFANLGTNFSVSRVKVLNLGNTHLREPQNSSGFVKSLILEEEIGEVTAEEAKVEVSDSNYEARRESNLAKVYQENEDDNEVKRGKDCDVSNGRWVFDESYPVYMNFSCPFIDEGFNCLGNGRLDKDYMKWRWQPYDCDIPRFNATNMLELIRGKRLVFAGDSINRNQWESLLCLLMGAVKDPAKVYETRGRRITKNRGSYSFRFVDYQCTVEFHVTHFLVREMKSRVGKRRKETLRIDTVARDSAKWRGADILFFNSGNWWTHFKTKAGIDYYQEGKQVYPHLDALKAYRKALITWATWVDKYINPQKTHIFFRSIAPAHFRGGQWNTGGHCREARRPLNKMYIDNPEKDLIAWEVINTMKTPVTFLNVTGLSSYRIDGHPSKYGKNPGKKGSTVEDCSHWCLPGVPDAWNELIYHQLLLIKQMNLYAS